MKRIIIISLTVFCLAFIISKLLKLNFLKVDCQAFNFLSPQWIILKNNWTNLYKNFAKNKFNS